MTDRHWLILSLKEEIRGLYREYTLSLFGLFNMAVQAHRRKRIPDLEIELVDLRSHVEATLAVIVTQHEAKIRQHAQAHAIADLKVKQDKSFVRKLENETILLSEIIDEVYFQLVRQASADSASVLSAYRRYALEARSAQLIGKSAYNAFPDVSAKSNDPLELKFLDRAGRRWDVNHYIDVTVGWIYFRYYNEIYLMGCAIRRRKTASVNYQDKAHRNQGLRFGIVRSTSKEPSYAEIRKEVFHPNSQAMVAK